MAMRTAEMARLPFRSPGFAPGFDRACRDVGFLAVTDVHNVQASTPRGGAIVDPLKRSKEPSTPSSMHLRRCPPMSNGDIMSIPPDNAATHRSHQKPRGTTSNSVVT